ncbi:MAG: CvpA family protein [Treponema sp.]|nr:CvpA family protein [Treponema sp.]
MNNASYIDIVFTVLAVLFTVRGFTRGFVKEFFSLGAPVLGVLGGFLFYKRGAEFIQANYFRNVKGVPEILAFIAIFFIIFIICKMLQKVLSDIIKGMNLSSLDKILGCIFGVIEGVAVIGLVVFLISIQPFVKPGDLLDNSLYGQLLLPFVSKPFKEGLDMVPKLTAGLLLRYFNGLSFV